MAEPSPIPGIRRRTPSFAFEPLTLTWAETAAIAFRANESWLRGHLAEYPDFPRPDAQTDLFAIEAVRAWVRRRYALVSADTTAEDAEAILLDRARHAQHPRPLPRGPAAKVRHAVLLDSDA